jgi:hypothetical protein
MPEPHWTIDDDGSEVELVHRGPQGVQYVDQADAGCTNEAWAALVAVVRAARLADDMAAAHERWAQAVADDTDEETIERLTADVMAKVGEVAALHHARQQGET